MILPKQSACSVEEKKSNKHPQNNELSVQQTLSSFAHLLSAEDTFWRKKDEFVLRLIFTR